MEQNNQWICFYEFYYPSTNEVEMALVKKFKNLSCEDIKTKIKETPVEIPGPLIIPHIDDKYKNMLQNSNVPKHLQSVKMKGNLLLEHICQTLRVNMMQGSALQTEVPQHKWELIDGTILSTETEIPPWKNLVIGQDDKIFKLLPLQSDQSHLSEMESVAAANWTNLVLDSLIKHLERNHQYTARENKMLQEIIDKILQKVDFTRDQLLDGIKTLGSNDLHIAKTIDVLEIGINDNSKWIGKVHSVVDKNQDITTSLKTSLEVVKKQVWFVSTFVESLKKKNTPDPTFKASTYFSDPQDQLPFHVVPTTLQ